MTAITVEKVDKYNRGMQLVKEGMSIRKAAMKVGVPNENLRSRVAGDVPVECRSGPMLTYLSEGAKVGLLEVIEHRALRGFCVGNAELRFLIRQAAIVSSIRPIPESFPDRTFVTRWIKKHPKSISFRKARVLEGKRAEASTEDVLATLSKKKTAKATKQQAKQARAEEKARAKIEKENAKAELAMKNALDREERVRAKAKMAAEKALKSAERHRAKEKKAHAKAERDQEKEELRLMRQHDKRPTKKRRTGIVAWVDL